MCTSFRTARVSFLEWEQVGALGGSSGGAWLPSSWGVGGSQLGEVNVRLPTSRTLLHSNCVQGSTQRSNSVFGRLGLGSIHGVVNLLRQLKHSAHGEFAGGVKRKKKTVEPEAATVKASTPGVPVADKSSWAKSRLQRTKKPNSQVVGPEWCN